MFIKVLKKNRSLWFPPQNFLKFLSNSVHFLDIYSRYAQNDSFTLDPTSFLKKSGSLRTFGSFLEKWQPISPASFRVKCSPNFLHLTFERLKNLQKDLVNEHDEWIFNINKRTSCKKWKTSRNKMIFNLKCPNIVKLFQK